MANRLPMHANQFSQTFLSHVGFQPRLTNALAKQSQNLLIRHAA